MILEICSHYWCRFHKDSDSKKYLAEVECVCYMMKYVIFTVYKKESWYYKKLDISNLRNVFSKKIQVDFNKNVMLTSILPSCNSSFL